jgi:hypothetical protein
VPLTNSARDSLVTALRLRAGISDTDPRIRQPAILVRDDGSTNSTSSTVQVTDTSVVLVGDTSGTDTLTFSAHATLTAMVAAIDNAADGRAATLVAPDGSEATENLAPRPATTLLDGDVTLYVESLALLDQLVDDALARMERYTRRQLFDAGQDVVRTLWNHGRTLVLDDPRVTSVRWVAVDSHDALRVRYTGTGRGLVAVTDTAVELQAIVPGTATVVTSIDLDDSTAVQDVVDSVNGTAGWTAELVEDGRSLDLVAMPPEDAGQELELEAWEPADDDYRVDLDGGVVYLDSVTRSYGGSRVAGQARVRYRAGFDPLPADLEGVLLTVAKAGLDAQRRDAGLQSESLGDYSWTAAAGSVPAAAMDEAIRAQAAVLDTYRRLLP